MRCSAARWRSAGAPAYAELAARQPEAGGDKIAICAKRSEARGVSHRVDVVRGRFQRRHCGRRRRHRGLSRPPCARRRQRHLGSPHGHIGPLAVTLSIRGFVAIAIILAPRLRADVRGVGFGRVSAELPDDAEGGGAHRRLPSSASSSPVCLAKPRIRRRRADSCVRVALLALVPVMFSCSRDGTPRYVAEEIRQPVQNVRARRLDDWHGRHRRAVPRAQRVYSSAWCRRSSSRGAMAVGEVAAERLFGSAAGLLFAVVAVVISEQPQRDDDRGSARVHFAMARMESSSRRRLACTRATAHPRWRLSRRPCGARCSCCQGRSSSS